MSLVSQVGKLSNDATAIHVRADAADQNSSEQIVQETIKALGPEVDILVNNMAIKFRKSVSQITKEDFDHVYHINILNPLLLTKAIIPNLRSSGRIINVSSVGAREGFSRCLSIVSVKQRLKD